MSDKCTLCPRKCGADRKRDPGFCGMTFGLRAARAGLHFWEEPVISGEGGSGTVFFSGCNLRCIFCQNKSISSGGFGKEITKERLGEIFDELVYLGCDNINLVTPTHFADEIIAVLKKHRPPVPVVWNSGGYESVETLRRLEGLVDIYLPDFKYADKTLASAFSAAPDYPYAALPAIEEMLRQRGEPRFDEYGMMTSGVIVRHLVLPGHVDNTLDVIDIFSERLRPRGALFSLMSQYTPPREELPYPELMRRLSKEEYDEAVGYLYLSGIEDGFVQELSSASEEYTPDFDLTGI